MIVLAILVLVTALVVGFLSRVGTDRASTASYSAVASTRQLADMAVNLVQAQINDASSQGTDKAWASQPGAVRVFNNSGTLLNIYRLYSADTMTTSNPLNLANDVPAGGAGGWVASPAVWVDLNAPVTISGTSSLSYPILDPRDPTNPANTVNMDGFFLGTSGPSGTVPGTTAVPLATGATANPIPMPVRWMYALKNGEIISPDTGGNGKLVTFTNAAVQPSKNNPIVGRIAFWTDDETCKVNINTAAGSLSQRATAFDPNALTAAPWDTPRFGNSEEISIFSKNQPLTSEYQRYPGHPGTTQLYNIFNGLGISMAPYPSANGSTSGLFSLLPRYNDDWGSKAGTINTTVTASPTPVTPRSFRLYTSVGEMLFDQSRTATGVNRQQTDTSGFFLTAHSRAPELTLFGTPRIAVWPVDKDLGTPPINQASNRATAIDRLIAFCASTGTGSNLHPYFFQRRNHWSPTEDFDPSIIPRNPQLYKYLQFLTSSAHPIPGFGGTFQDKYGQAERDQILTEIADYIRCTNLYDYRSAAQSNDSLYPRYTPGWLGTGGGQVAPLKVATNGRTTHGLGRNYTLSEIGVHIICTAEGSAVAHVNNNAPASPATVGYMTPDDIGGTKVSPARGSANDPQYVSNLPVAQYLRKADGTIVGWDSTNYVYTVGTASAVPAAGGPFPANKTLAPVYSASDPGDAVPPWPPLAPGDKRLQAILLMEAHSPMNGYFEIFPSYQIKVAGIEGLSLGGSTPFPSAANGTIKAYPEGNRGGGNYAIGGSCSFREFLKNDTGSPRVNRWSNPASSNLYPFVSDPFTVVAADLPKLNIGGACQIELDVVPNSTIGNATAGVPIPVQTFNVSFPLAGTPITPPDLIQYGIDLFDASGNETVKTSASDWWGFDVRFNNINKGTRGGKQGTTEPYQGLNTFFRLDPATTPTAAQVLANGGFVPAPWELGARYTGIPLAFNNTIYNGLDATSHAYSGTWPGARCDAVRSLIANDGDVRLIAAKETVDASGGSSADFAKQTGYDSGARLAHSFTEADTSKALAGCDLGGKLAPLSAAIFYGPMSAPKVPSTFVYPYGDSGSYKGPQTSWDWDNSIAPFSDGAYANKPDEGSNNPSATPYYDTLQEPGHSPSFFTASRIIPSAVMFGSLPTGVVEGVPWRTLLFRPQANRPVWAAPPGPKDHLLLDLFDMPVVEPYAISEPFSTAGKVNMNYQIAPFSYITRNTAIRAVLGSELIAKVPGSAASQAANSYASAYKNKGSAATNGVARLPVNLSETDGALRQFRDRFNGTGAYTAAGPSIFLSASEICDIYLVPQGYNWTSDSAADSAWYGTDFALAGDNVRERPYADIYPRLTTKSNTFTVHFTVQALKNLSTDPAQWNEDRGIVLGEYRGSTTIERYLDPNDPNIPDYGDGTDPTTKTPIDSFYRWRIVANRRFYP